MEHKLLWIYIPGEAKSTAETSIPARPYRYRYREDSKMNLTSPAGALPPGVSAWQHPWEPLSQTPEDPAHEIAPPVRLPIPDEREGYDGARLRRAGNAGSGKGKQMLGRLILWLRLCSAMWFAVGAYTIVYSAMRRGEVVKSAYGLLAFDIVCILTGTALLVEGQVLTSWRPDKNIRGPIHPHMCSAALQILLTCMAIWAAGFLVVEIAASNDFDASDVATVTQIVLLAIGMLSMAVMVPLQILWSRAMTANVDPWGGIEIGGQRGEEQEDTELAVLG